MAKRFIKTPTRTRCFSLCPMRRRAKVVKFLRRFFQKADGGVWGRAPTDTAFLFWRFFLAPAVSKKKAAACDGLFRENGLLFGGRSPHPPQAVPLPRWGRLHELICSFCFKVFGSKLFSKSLAGFGAAPQVSAFSFGAFLLCLLGSKEKRLNAMGSFGRTKRGVVYAFGV